MTIFLVLSTIFVGSVMKGAIGIGLPLLATPVLSIYLGVPAAVAREVEAAIDAIKHYH